MCGVVQAMPGTLQEQSWPYPVLNEWCPGRSPASVVEERTSLWGWRRGVAVEREDDSETIRQDKSARLWCIQFTGSLDTRPGVVVSSINITNRIQNIMC